jgi:hypothetical protein
VPLSFLGFLLMIPGKTALREEADRFESMVLKEESLEVRTIHLSIRLWAHVFPPGFLYTTLKARQR